MVVAKGKITIELTITALNCLAKLPGFEKDFNILVDARYIDFHPSYHEVLKFQRHLVFMKNNFQKKIALVTTEFFWVVGELISDLSKPHGLNISAFSDLEKAYKWIWEVNKVT